VELPRLQALADEYSKRGIAFVSVATMEAVDIPGVTTSLPRTLEEGIGKLQRLVKFNGMTVPLGLALPKSDYKGRYREGAGRTIILDKDGRVVFTAAFQPTYIREALEQLLKLGA
jgi:hypothetical protein